MASFQWNPEAIVEGEVAPVFKAEANSLTLTLSRLSVIGANPQTGTPGEHSINFCQDSPGPQEPSLPWV